MMSIVRDKTAMDDFILPFLVSTSVGNSKMKEGSTAVFGFDIRVLLYNGMFRGQRKAFESS